MKTNIIKIGNSHGVILPLSILRQLKLANGSAVELEVQKGMIVIKPHPRQGWEEAAKKVNSEKDEWTW